jgi:hypothetical protein
MVRKAFKHVLSSEDRRVVRNWTWGVLIFYAAVALTGLGFVSVMQHLPDKSNNLAAAAAIAASSRSDR